MLSGLLCAVLAVGQVSQSPHSLRKRVFPCPVDVSALGGESDGEQGWMVKRSHLSRAEPDMHYVMGTAFSPSGRFLAVVTNYGWLQVFDLEAGGAFWATELDRAHREEFEEWMTPDSLKDCAGLLHYFWEKRAGIGFVSDEELVVGTWSGTIYRITIDARAGRLSVAPGPKFFGAIGALLAAPTSPTVVCLSAGINENRAEDPRGRPKIHFLVRGTWKTLHEVVLCDPRDEEELPIDVVDWCVVEAGSRALFLDDDGRVWGVKIGEERLRLAAEFPKPDEGRVFCQGLAPDGSAVARYVATTDDPWTLGSSYLELFSLTGQKTWHGRRIRIETDGPIQVYCGRGAERVFVFDFDGGVELLLEQGTKVFRKRIETDIAIWGVSADERRIVQMARDIEVIEFPFPK